MIKKVIVITIICLALSSASAKKWNKIYWIDGNVTVLTFVGNPDTLQLTPIKLKTYEKQPIKLLHKKSGPGIYAFYLPGFISKNADGGKEIIQQNGFFMVKKRNIRTTKFKKKISMKYKSIYKYQQGDYIK